MACAVVVQKGHIAKPKGHIQQHDGFDGKKVELGGKRENIIVSWHESSGVSQNQFPLIQRLNTPVYSQFLYAPENCINKVEYSKILTNNGITIRKTSS